MIAGRRQRRRLVLRRAQADRAATTAPTAVTSILVRNPNYDQSTDSQYRKNYPNEFQFLVNSNADDIFTKVAAGRLSTTRCRARRRRRSAQYATDPTLKPRLITERRRPHVLLHDEPDAAAVRRHPRPQGDELDHGQDGAPEGVGRPDHRRDRDAHRPAALYNNGLAEYDPYATPDDAGSVDKAKAEMKQSKYDTDKNGKCDASACKNVLHDRRHPRRRHDAWSRSSRPTPRRSASRSRSASINGAYPTIQTPSKNVPISERPGWGKDYADPFTFFGALFDAARSSRPATRTTRSSASRRRSRRRSSVNGQRSTTSRASTRTSTGCAQARRRRAHACYENLDKKLMTKVVPWVPYLWSNDVHHRPERHALGLRPVRDDARLRARRGQVVNRDTHGGRGAPRRRPRSTASPGGHDADLHRTPARLDGPRRRSSCSLITFAGLLHAADRRPGAALRRQVPTPESSRRSGSGSASTSRWYVQFGYFVKHFVTRRRVRLAGPRLLVRRATCSVKDQIMRARAAHALADRRAPRSSGSSSASRSACSRRSSAERSSTELAMGFALFGISAPVFWLGLMALYIFWRKLGWTAGTGLRRRSSTSVAGVVLAHDPARGSCSRCSTPRSTRA